MPRSYGFLLLVWAPLWACCVSAPKPEDWLAVGFRTPEQTFRTFQTGLRADLPDLEYRCFSPEFLRENVRNQAVYREFREELFRRQPLLKLAATAKVVARDELPGGLVRLTARVETVFGDEVFAVDFAREDFYEIREAGEVVDDGFRRLDELCAYRNESYIVELPDEVGIPLDHVSEITVGSQWLIAAIPMLEESSLP